MNIKERIKEYIEGLISNDELNCLRCNSGKYYGAIVIDTDTFRFNIENKTVKDLLVLNVEESNIYIEIKCHNEKCSSNNGVVKFDDFPFS